MKESPAVRLVRPEQAAAMLGISRAKLYEMMRRGDLRSVVIDRCRRIRVEDIDEFIASLGDPNTKDENVSPSRQGTDSNRVRRA